VDLELVEGSLDLPALRVGGSEVEGGDVFVVEDGGEQPVGLVVGATIIDSVVDDPVRCPPVPACRRPSDALKLSSHLHSCTAVRGKERQPREPRSETQSAR